ncbi:MAG: hypothetical protein II008_14220 [Oscillospiraceae bacterium]|nr:hypothetical protein [Oscillospiraceae bacterium]
MSRRKYTKLSELTASEGLERFRRNDSLVHRKLLSYLPFMITTNLATLLLSTVDGVVVGNLVGSEALSAVSIFMPITFVISIVCTWVPPASPRRSRPAWATTGSKTLPR